MRAAQQIVRPTGDARFLLRFNGPYDERPMSGIIADATVIVDRFRDG